MLVIEHNGVEIEVVPSTWVHGGVVVAEDVKPMASGRHLNKIVVRQDRAGVDRTGQPTTFTTEKTLDLWNRPDLAGQLLGCYVQADGWNQSNRYDGFDGTERLGENHNVRAIEVKAPAKVAKAVEAVVA